MNHVLMFSTHSEVFWMNRHKSYDQMEKSKIENIGHILENLP